MSWSDKKANTNSEQLTLFEIEKKRVELSYSGEKISSDGGLLLLRGVEERTGIIKQLCSCISDPRDQRYIDHPLYELISQRVFQIACGYEDGNDCNMLRDDPIFKLSVGKLPKSGEALASQPTMSRLENSVSRSDLYRIARCIADSFISSYTEEPFAIILDCDDTNNNTHGSQQLCLYNDYYGEYCYMPLHIYEGLSGKLITTILKPGHRSKGVDVLAIVKRIISYLRQYWKNTFITIRGDSHFTSPELMDWAEDQHNVNFITGLSGNKALTRLAETTIKSAQKSFKSTGQPVKMYHKFTYKAGSWKHSRRVIVKVEVTEKGTNVRYVVTDLPKKARIKLLYEKAYCARGKMELNIKDHKTYLKSDRSSCSRFEANQMRLFLHSAAYMLLHALRENVLKTTEFAHATMETLQLKLLKVGAHVTEMKTKIKVVLSRCCPVKTIQLNCYRIFGQLTSPLVLSG